LVEIKINHRSKTGARPGLACRVLATVSLNPRLNRDPVDCPAGRAMLRVKDRGQEMTAAPANRRDNRNGSDPGDGFHQLGDPARVIEHARW
jgi:hypothetical protein